MVNVKAVNPKHQGVINKFIMWNAKYDEIVNATNDNGGRKQENAYDKAAEFLSRLPAREKANIARQIDLAGY
jgi:hypothetical protein